MRQQRTDSKCQPVTSGRGLQLHRLLYGFNSVCGGIMTDRGVVPVFGAKALSQLGDS